MTKEILVELEMRESDIEAVVKEFEAENPGKTARDLEPKEFADRMLKKIMATATIVEEEGGNA
jgi:hypothetical protein